MGLLVAVALVFFGLHEPERRVGPLPPPTTEDAAYTRIVLLTLEHIGRQPERSGDLLGTLDEFNGLFRLLARTHPWLAGQLRLDSDALHLDASLRPPWGDRLGWLNVSAVIPAYEDGLRLRSLRVGRLALPPAATLRLVTWGVDRQLGEGTAEQALAVLPWLEIEDDRITWGIAMPAGSERHLSRAGITEFYGRELPTRTEVGRFVTVLDAAALRGDLPTEGSFLPWLNAMFDQALEMAEADDGNLDRALIAGFMALNLMCGSGRRYGSLLLPPRAPGEGDIRIAGRGCHRASLRNRADLRQHFVTAATIKMMSDRSVAVGAGEAKELVDLLYAGYDFTDIAANNSGIRLATIIGDMSPDQLRALRARIGSEEDVMISIAGIPGEMRPAAFRYRFGDLDSPAYREMIDIIEARIDALPIHAAGQGG